MVAAAQATALDPYFAALARGRAAPLPTGPLGQGPWLRVFKVGLYDPGTEQEHDYTAADLDDAVTNFDRFSQGPDALHTPPLVLGHVAQQRMLSEHTGLPCAGVVAALERRGDELWALVDQVPEPVRQWIRAGQYRWLSPEFYLDPQEAQIQAPHLAGASGMMLRRLSLLGGTPPKNKDLGQIPLAEFGESRAGGMVAVSVRLEGGGVRFFAEGGATVADEPNDAGGGGGLDANDLLEQCRQKGYPDHLLDLLSSMPEALSILATLPPVQAPEAPAAAVPPEAPAMADAGDAAPTREAMIAAILAADPNVDPEQLAAMDDTSLAALYTSKSGGAATGLGVTANPAVHADPATPATPLDPSRLGQTTVPTMSEGDMKDPKKVAAFCEALVKTTRLRLEREAKAVEAKQRAQAQAAHTRTRVREFCERMVRERRLLPAQAEYDQQTGEAKGATPRYLLSLATVRTFSEQAKSWQPSQLDLALREIESRPVIGFGELIQDPLEARGAAGKMAAARRKHLLSQTPDGKYVLERDKKTA